MSEEEAQVDGKNIVEEARLVLEDIKKANAETAILAERIERARATDILSGKADAGQATKTETEDEKIDRESKEFVKRAYG